MGQFDLKNAIVSLCDGRKATLTTTAVSGVNGRLLLTDVSTHRGTQPAVRIVIVNAGVSHLTLDVTVSGTTITVTPITDGASAITSTAAQVRTAMNLVSGVTDLVVVTLPGTGGAVVSAQASTPLTNGARTMQVKVAEGVISYTEKKDRKYTKDRGKLGTVMNADEMPMEVKINAIWEFLTDDATPMFEDALKNRNFCSNWVTTDTDACAPYCVDVEVAYDPGCGVLREFITLPLFRYEDFGHSFKDGVLDLSGKCNVQEATLLRVA